MKILRGIMIGLCVLLLVLVMGLLLVAHSNKAMRYVLQHGLSQGRNVTVRNIRIGELFYSFPSSWILKGVQAELLTGDKVVFMSAADVTVNDVLALLSAGGKSEVVLNEADLSWEQFNVDNVSGRISFIRSSEGWSYQGAVFAASVFRDKIGSSLLKADIAGNVHRMDIQSLTADLYGGKLSGRGAVIFGSPASYSLDCSLKGADTVQLGMALGGAFREFGGRLTGSVRLQGQGARIDALNTSWNLPSGGEISASLLSSIAGYLPASVEKKRLDGLIQSGGKLAVEVFLFTLRNVAPDHLTGEIGLKSRSANLEINLSHDITIDARIDSLLRAWEAVFKR